MCITDETPIGPFFSANTEAQPPVECDQKVKSKAVVYIRELADGSMYLSGGGHGKAAGVARRMQVQEQNCFRDTYPPMVVLPADVVVEVRNMGRAVGQGLEGLVDGDEEMLAFLQDWRALLALLPKETNDE